MDLGNDRVVCEIVRRLSDAGGVVMVAGTWGSFARVLTAYISSRVDRPILYICPHIDDADNAVDDLATFGAGDVEQPRKGWLGSLAAWEGEEDIADATDEIRGQRLKLVARLSSLGPQKDAEESPRPADAAPRNAVIVASPVQAICQPVPKREALEQSRLRFRAGGEMSPERVAQWLVDNGFERVDKVDLPGQFARRGGIIDIYAPLMQLCRKEPRNKIAGLNINGDEEGELSGCTTAVRVEFFADQVESIREIDLDTQRSSGDISELGIVSAVCGSGQGERELFTNLLPADTIVILDEPGDIEEVARVYLERVEDTARLWSWEDIYRALERFTQLHVCRFAAQGPALGAGDEFLKVDVRSVQQYQHKQASLWAGHKQALAELVAEAKKGKRVLLYCDAEAEISRIGEIIRAEHSRIPRNFKLVKGYVHQGFALPSLDTIVISHHELFGQFAVRRRYRPVRASAPVDTLEDLQPGDYVVHASYGIGKFRGIETIEEKGAQSEYLTIEYDGGVKIQVSVRNIALVQKYIGTSPRRPKLSKVGSKRWARQKEKVARSVQDLASGLLEIQARREAMGGISFGDDSSWQVEFEESFAYQETPDQMTAGGEIKRDMQRAVAMDRLLCGDVGYGKTELAMRAAFKAVEGGRQVAVLVPTTVLSVQHARTFAERFADFPVVIEVLNRFRTTRQARDIIARTKAGKVDILIGTHRLLSGDVRFKDLGLLIIDEEQRFGVEHKERLKRMRVNVDILTMTATPIPRTLHMAMLGLRDISSLATPPLDRRSIVTTVTGYSDELIKRAILRELNRQGQVFFVHNRVKTIEKKAWEVGKLVPDARLRIAHGQMAKSELEKAMIDFVLGDTDVLVCTTIIESGLDIPNANTMIINDADRFGLAELHQLRGRVGRYKHRAYAYMLLSRSRPITPIAARRLKAIEEYSHLGAGFRIALRDLEIRGAGNILGPEQSGYIQTVGYQMYCELLSDAVRQLCGEPAEAIPTAVVDLGFACYIPKSYIASDRQRMDVYRKIAVARTNEDLEQIEGELADVYGPVPEQVKILLEVAELRILASGRQIKSIVVQGGNLVFSFAGDGKTKAKHLFKDASARFTVADDKIAYLHLSKNYFEPTTLMSVVHKMLAKE